MQTPLGVKGRPLLTGWDIQHLLTQLLPINPVFLAGEPTCEPSARWEQVGGELQTAREHRGRWGVLPTWTGQRQVRMLTQCLGVHGPGQLSVGFF